MLILLTAFLWAYGGAHGTSLGWRRVGVPMSIAYLICLRDPHGGLIAIIPLMFAALCIGYGMPDGKDAGSAIGRFWTNIWPMQANLMTRLTFSTIIALSLLPLLLVGNWWIGALIGIIGNTVVTSVVEVKGKTWILLNEEIGVGAIWGFAAIIGSI